MSNCNWADCIYQLLTINNPRYHSAATRRAGC